MCSTNYSFVPKKQNYRRCMDDDGACVTWQTRFFNVPIVKHWYTGAFFLGRTSAYFLFKSNFSWSEGDRTHNPWVGSRVFYHWAKSPRLCDRRRTDHFYSSFLSLSLLKHAPTCIEPLCCDGETCSMFTAKHLLRSVYQLRVISSNLFYPN